MIARLPVEVLLRFTGFHNIHSNVFDACVDLLPDEFWGYFMNAVDPLCILDRRCSRCSHCIASMYSAYFLICLEAAVEKGAQYRHRCERRRKPYAPPEESDPATSRIRGIPPGIVLARVSSNCSQVILDRIENLFLCFEVVMLDSTTSDFIRRQEGWIST
jgi:hypothetical protein